MFEVELYVGFIFVVKNCVVIFTILCSLGNEELAELLQIGRQVEVPKVSLELARVRHALLGSCLPLALDLPCPSGEVTCRQIHVGLLLNVESPLQLRLIDRLAVELVPRFLQPDTLFDDLLLGRG